LFWQPSLHNALGEYESSGCHAQKILVVDDFIPWHGFVVEMFESEEAHSNIFSFAVDGWKSGPESA
jgi:hypothetical protein